MRIFYIADLLSSCTINPVHSNIYSKIFRHATTIGIVNAHAACVVWKLDQLFACLYLRSY